MTANVLTFGKYAGKTFEYVLDHDINYCRWVLTIHPHMNQKNMHLFKEFVKTTIGIMPIPTIQLNVTDLAKYYYMNLECLALIEKLNIISIDVDNKFNGLSDLNNFDPAIFGTFIDYLIRYKISQKQHVEFNDRRCQFAIDYSTSIDVAGYTHIHASYTKMQAFTADLNDICNASLYHSLYFGRDISSFVDFIKNNHISLNTIILDQFIECTLAEKTNVLCNPVLGNKEFMLGGDADLIVDDELIDFKCSKYEIGAIINDFIQLLIYVCLYYVQTGIKCTKLTIFNPIVGIKHCVDIGEWDFEPMIKLLRKRVAPS